MVPDETLSIGVAYTFCVSDLLNLTLVSKKMRRVAYIAAGRRVRNRCPFFLAPCYVPSHWDERSLEHDIQRLMLCEMRMSSHYMSLLRMVGQMFPCRMLNANFRNPRLYTQHINNWCFLRNIADHPYAMHRLASEQREGLSDRCTTVDDSPCDLIRRLHMELGISPNITDEDGHYPIYYAVKEGRQLVVDTLVECGARIEDASL